MVWRAALSCATLLWLSCATAPNAIAVDMGSKAETVAEPDDYRTDDYRKPVPATLKGAKVIAAEEASKLWSEGRAVFIDVYPHAPKPPNLPANTVWREPQHFSIENAKWLANVGYGVLSEEAEGYFKRNLERLTGGDKSKPVVFFCLRNCWMSWNSAKRAMTYGYTNVIWFSEGTDAWQEIGQPIAEAKPEP
jgi:PQQ-dependent catabolism-associated CXXCW motif protein